LGENTKKEMREKKGKRRKWKTQSLSINITNLDGILALGKSVPQLDGPVPGARNNLE
jgi:hypothetical protein